MNMDRVILCAALGFGLDLLFGDPAWFYHPVRLIGHLISLLERILRRVFPKTPAGERAAGAVMAVLTVSVTGFCALLWCRLWDLFGMWGGLAGRAFLCYRLLAVRSLRDESMKVYGALGRGSLAEARKAVSMIVGRDTERLDETGVVKAAVETVAENTSDGVIAPLFFVFLGGPVLGWMYKAVNTMDSMTGYKNERYLHFGFVPAKLDDIVNFVPARIAALLMITASAARLDAAEALRIFRRDRYRHASPNSAQTESVMAGALHVQLAGDAWYFGERYHKETIGDPGRPAEAEDIRRANKVLYITAAMGLVLFSLVRLCAGIPALP